MTHPLFQIHKMYFVQQGDTSTFLTGGNDYCVLEETWEGKQLLDTVVVKRYPPTPEGERQAEAHVQRLNEEKDVSQE